MKITEEMKKNIGKIFVIVIIALFLEIFLFNIGSFRLVGKDYQSKIVSIEDCELQGLEKSTPIPIELHRIIRLLPSKRFNKNVVPCILTSKNLKETKY